jgi:hypothetical protein
MQGEMFLCLTSQKRLCEGNFSLLFWGGEFLHFKIFIEKYDFFQVVIPKSDLREEGSESPNILENLETYYL